MWNRLRTDRFSAAASALVYLPISILLGLTTSKNGNPILVPPDYIWTLALVYTAFAWSYSIFIEQLFCAELYLWNNKWEKMKSKLPENEQAGFKLEDVEKHSIIDDVADLKAS